MKKKKKIKNIKLKKNYPKDNLLHLNTGISNYYQFFKNNQFSFLSMIKLKKETIIQ